MVDELKCGIEIHQQLDTKKLFCQCECELVDEPGGEFMRRLRPSQSEMGEIDRAALLESKKRMSFVYQAPPSVSCLVERDEEPPHAANPDAMDAVLTVSRMMGCQVLDEVHFMRKIVIDGSNTTGFQRTSLVSMDGNLEVNGRSISIQSVCLEEDAARKVETNGRQVTYRIDRLGIPLIEIATGPDMRTPEEVREVAYRIGSLLRATKKVKRGIGTIREDLNISIPGGARIEIKGVQELRMLPIYVDVEMHRQQSLLRIRDLLRERGVTDVNDDIMDVTDAFKTCDSKVIRSAIKAKGRVWALPLNGYQGVLRSEDGSMRLGSELAGRARTRGVKGVFHTDEMPAYGIGVEDVKAVRDLLGIGDEGAFVLCAAKKIIAEDALDAVKERAIEALHGVPEETRDPMLDGTSRYSRPLPGAARMYPETDVPPICIDAERLARIDSNLPELPEEKAARFVAEYGVHEQQAQQLAREYDELFETLAVKGMAGVAASVILGTFPEMEREGLASQDIPHDSLVHVFDRLAAGDFAKEALPDIMRQLAQGKDVDGAIEALGLTSLDHEEAYGIIQSLVKGRESFIRERGMDAMGPLMGPVMQELRGKVDGKQASDLLRRAITELLE